MPFPTRSPERLRHHYDVERELAARMRASTRKERTELFKTLYTELFERVPDHPRLTRRETSEQSRSNVEKQFRLIAPHLKPDMTFLEIAPGDCRLALEASKHCSHVIGVDISDQRNPDESFPDNFELIVYDGYQLDPVPDASIDIIFSYQFLEHLHPEDVPLHFDLAQRLLKPGGFYILDTPHRYSGPHDISRFFGSKLDCFHFQEWTIRSLKKTLCAHGFEQVWVYRFGKVHKSNLFNIATSIAEAIAGILPRPLRQSISRKLFPAVTLMGKKVKLGDGYNAQNQL
jgi:ubiquinone/menaquinone biosynthesis C-methylase UbiE